MSGLTAPPLLLLLAIASAATAQQIPPCASDLIPCVEYLNSTAVPLASCCGPLKDAVKYQAPCLCGLFNDTSLLKAYGIDLKPAFKLRKLCGITATRASVCGKVAAAAPSTSATEGGALAAQPFPSNVAGEGNKKSSSKVAVIVGPVLGGILLGTLLYFLWWILKRRNAKRVTVEGFGRFGQPSNIDLPFVDLAIIQAATGKFSDASKLGEGGFGPVYKGTLQGGREIAVKRLSTKSIQGVSEFKNEVKLIAKLQHRNLARVLGCCIEKEEKLLIYEYAPNKSLDSFLFDENKRSQLDWMRRRLIIAGIARGLLYLHEDSLPKVIHRDLKASNVLLDKAMNPKISDFGMAKIFETDGTAVNTGRVVGTFGYMAPEYAMYGIFSEKSDVYSFGVLLLEIVSGQKNVHGQTLLRHAWQLWSEDKATELIDELLGDSYPPVEAMRVIHIGLLCVQESAEERLTMSLVVHALRSDQMVLPEPAQPLTFSDGEPQDIKSIDQTEGQSINEVTITELTPG